MTVLRRATPEQLSAFSDGVFAVLIAVLVLELRPPELPTFTVLVSLWPTWLSYAVSYLFIAIVWTNHHYLMRYALTAIQAVESERIGPATSCLLRSGLLPRERDLHSSDLGAY